MDFRKLSSDAGAFISRAIQKTEEKFGNVDKTEFGTQIDLLIKQAQKTKEWSIKLVEHLEVMVEPNLASRLQSKMFDSSSASKINEYDTLASLMSQAGQDLQASQINTLGDSLCICGSTEKKVAEAMRSLLQTTVKCLINPLKTFLDGEMKTIEKEIEVLEEKRLDYDSIRNKVKKASDPDLLKSELEEYKGAYERQLQVTKHQLLAIDSTHTHHKKCLEEFFRAQRNYHELCAQETSKLAEELQKM